MAGVPTPSGRGEIKRQEMIGKKRFISLMKIGCNKQPLKLISEI